MMTIHLYHQTQHENLLVFFFHDAVWPTELSQSFKKIIIIIIIYAIISFLRKFSIQKSYSTTTIYIFLKTYPWLRDTYICLMPVVKKGAELLCRYIWIKIKFQSHFESRGDWPELGSSRYKIENTAYCIQLHNYKLKNWYHLFCFC